MFSFGGRFKMICGGKKEFDLIMENGGHFLVQLNRIDAKIGSFSISGIVLLLVIA